MLRIGALKFSTNLIQGPLAGYSCAPMRQLFRHYLNPAYCVSEMISAQDVIHKHDINSRFLYRSPKEGKLCYQISGSNPVTLAQASAKLEDIGADLIDINCGCPQRKIRRRGAGSALLNKPNELIEIVSAVRKAIDIPLTVKIRIQNSEIDNYLANSLENCGVDALIVHGRRWTDSYDTPCNYDAIHNIKQQVSIPVIANGDINCFESLQTSITTTMCDAYMVSRAGCGAPWLFKKISTNSSINITTKIKSHLLIEHLFELEKLESEHKSILQSKSLIRYYFSNELSKSQILAFYQLQSLKDIVSFCERL